MDLRVAVLNKLAMAAIALTLAMSAGAHAQSAAPVDVSVQVKDALQTCFQCHGPGGVSVIPTRPTIAGQKAEYIRRQLVAFKNSATKSLQEAGIDARGAENSPRAALRRDPVMEHMAEGMPDHLLAPLAQAVSQLACAAKPDKAPRVPPPALPQQRPAAAQACVVCHGEDGIGVQNQVPNLAGQQRSYLRRQLLLLRETAWGARPREGEAWRSHPIMEAKAARLKITDIDAIAQYYTALDCQGAGQ